MTSGNLKDYIRKLRNPTFGTIQSWAKQILKGLSYLHSHSPPIIHRDIKCENIFINGSNGEVKIGDLGTAKMKAGLKYSVVGTPEFMAPEMYEDGGYDEKVDIYAFGMALIEMFTGDYPYCECENAAQVYRRVSKNIKPLSLEKIQQPDFRHLIENCIGPSDLRWTAKEITDSYFGHLPEVVFVSQDLRADIFTFQLTYRGSDRISIEFQYKCNTDTVEELVQEMDCHNVVAEKFFPLVKPDGTADIFCERDYFARMDLLCAKCGMALRGPHINALNKKYHLEHFTCSVCPTVFRQHDSYYERDGEVFCQYHYSVLFASKCGGCQTAVLKKFVEMNKDNKVQQWHPECYMIYKLWNVKVNFRKPEAETPNNLKDTEAEIARQQATLEKVSRILAVLSSFEESSAECIADMLIHFSNQEYEAGVMNAGRLIRHVAVIFAGIDHIEMELARYGDETGLQHRKEPKHLAKKIVHFFSLLTNGSGRGGESGKETTKEMITLVTSLANTLKSLIRSSLNGALKLVGIFETLAGVERKYDVNTAISGFLDRLAMIEAEDANSTNIQSFMPDYDAGMRVDLCKTCQKSVDEACLKINALTWHMACFRCSACGRDLATCMQEARADMGSNRLFCTSHATAEAVGGARKVSQLEQFTFLLHCALARLCVLLNLHDRNNPRALLDRVADRSNMPMTMPHEPEPPRHPAAYYEQNQMFSSADDMSKYPSDPNLISQSNSSIAERRIPDQFQQQQQLQPSFQSPFSQQPQLPANGRYLSEQLGLDRLSIRRQATTLLEKCLAGIYTPAEVAEFVNIPKPSVWSRMVGAMNGAKRAAKTKEGTFGVPLETLVDKTGVNSDIGPGPNLSRIPRFVDLCIRSLKSMDLTVEGIFRKNGNIRRLKEVSDLLDQNPDMAQLGEDNAIQLAALLKKFLRELPEPLLSFQLHPLLLASQRMPDLATSKQVIHLCVSLLPKVNLDLLQVLLLFLRDVSNLANLPNGAGNKMDITNLATVIAPNILYAKSGNAAEDESFTAVRVVEMLIEHQDLLRLVPQNIVLEGQGDSNMGNDNPLRLNSSNLLDRNRMEVSISGGARQ
ncbi:hypothetical protein HDU76_003532 [Blyttiomyces sp. JEL0837]|nr:hypothetical protein HDU76_003532 [Blyttiomyces sp. JEL0837]